MDSRELSLFFVWCLLNAETDDQAFEKYKHALYMRGWGDKNRLKVRQGNAASYVRNHVSRCATVRRYAAANPDVVAAGRRRYYERNKTECKARASAYRKTPEGLAWLRRWGKNKRASDPVFRLMLNIRTRLYFALKGASAAKSESAIQYLGCTAGEWMTHLEKSFKPGMTRDNYGPVWHVDHIRPCASFDLANPQEVEKCFHFSNTQALFGSENCSKGAKWQSA